MTIPPDMIPSFPGSRFNSLNCTTSGLAQGVRAGWEQASSHPLSIQGTNLSAKQWGAFSCSAFFGDRLVWLLQKKKIQHHWKNLERFCPDCWEQKWAALLTVGMEASGNSNTRLPKTGCDIGPREGYKCLDIWTDPCHWRQPWKQKITQTKGNSLWYNTNRASPRGVCSHNQLT